ncbi:hypothetical protein ACIBJI_26770 [Nocardia sp. NPDC050408]|uniref:hypothetical protein n=1 Tax=unclassified Nocardia TaxID=2637762 RepID=UPI00342987FD
MFEWSAGDLGSAMLGSLTDWIAGEERQPGVDPAAVQTKYNQQRDGVRSTANGIGFHGDYRPRSVKNRDDFDTPTTSQLREKVDKIDITAVDNLATAWNEIGKRAETSLNTFNKAMERATDESIWKGASRDAVAKAVSDYSTQAMQLANAAKLTGSKVAELKTGLEPTKALVPHAPELRSNVENARHWVAGRGWRDNDEAESTAHAEAVRVLRTVYAPVIEETDTNVPVIPKPDNPTAKPGETPTVGPGYSPGGSQPGTSTGGTEPTGKQEPASTEDGQSTDPSNTQSTDSSTTPTASTEPTTTKPDTTATNPSSTTMPTTTGSSTGSGSPSGIPGTTSQSPGRTVTGAPTGTATSAAAATTTAATTGRSGMSGMGSPGSRGGKDENESTKGVPDYLINQQNGEELIGLDSAPKTVPPVIGE